MAFILIGFLLLTFGGDLIVRGISHAGLRLGVSSLTVGLIFASLATSSPELAVSLGAAWMGQADVAVGNVLGSNILNVLVVLGICAAIRSLVVDRRLIWHDVPIMVGVSFLFYFLSADQSLSRFDGGVLLVTSAIYLYMTYQAAQRERQVGAVPDTAALSSWPKISFQMVLGVVLLIVGARLLVIAATTVARAWGVSELIIGLTIVAVGTSLPELATSVAASLRGERDIAVGNIVGSNIFNIVWVIGLSALLAPVPIGVSASALSFDFPVMCAVAVACLPIFFSGHEISRWEGFLFIAYYVAYVVYLFLNSQGHTLLPMYSKMMWVFVLPLTVVTLGVGVVRHLTRAKV